MPIHAGRPGSWCCLLLLVSLAGCVAPSPSYVKVDDPFKQIGSTRSARFADLKLALVVSGNSNAALQHVAETKAKNFLQTDYPELDPRNLVADINRVLQAQFKEVHRVENLDQARAAGADLVMVLDLRIQIGIAGIREAQTQIESTFHGLDGSPVEVIRGAGTERSILYDGKYMFAKNWKLAIHEFDDHLANSAKLAAFARARNLATVDAEGAPSGGPLQSSQGAAARAADGRAAFGNYFALVVGNDSYVNVPVLKTAVRDAQSVSAILRDEYGFKVKLMLNATRAQMLDAFDEYRRNLHESDNLLIYYAGHGYLDPDSDRGYWLPVDADQGRRANWLSNTDIADTVRAVRAIHVLVVADSCYSGTLTRGLSVLGTAQDDYARLAQKRARTALSSGGLEPVEDAGGGGHSVFANAFMNALHQNPGIVDMSQIFSSIRREVMLASPQTPRYGDIRQAGHDGGDFVFVKMKPGPTP